LYKLRINLKIQSLLITIYLRRKKLQKDNIKTTELKREFHNKLLDFINRETYLAESNESTKSELRNSIANTNYTIIGSSIVHILKACALASSGANVTIIEQNNSMGGVWSSINTLGLYNVERATHIFMPCPLTYKLFEEVFNYRFIEIDPKPISISVKNDSNIISKNQFPIHNKTSNPLIKYEGPCLHPINGPNALFNHLLDFSKKLGVKLKTNTKVNSVEIYDDITNIICSSDTLTTDKVIISRGSPIPQIKDKETTIIPFLSSNNISIHFLIDPADSNKFSFIHFNGHSLIVELQDITDITSGIEKGLRLIVCKLKYNLFELNQLSLIDTKTLFQSIIKLGLLSENSKIIATNITGYPQTRLSEIAVKEIYNRYGRIIKIIPFVSISMKEEEAHLSAQDISVALSSNEFLKNLI